MSVWLDPVTDLRKTLSDGPTDKLSYRKKLIGTQDGVNNTFKTFETRRISDLVAPVSPAGVFLDYTPVTVLTDDLTSGQFTVAPPLPTDGQQLVATYYLQWFLDEELQTFLSDASVWAGFSADYLTVPDDFRSAVKEYAAGLGYQKLVLKFAVNLAETYQLYDAPDEKRFNPIDAYAKISKMKFDLALKLRDDVYSRKGAAKAPRSGVARGYVVDVPPKT